MTGRLWIALSLCAAAAIAAAGCGGGGSDVDVGPAAAVPANTPIYFEATVRPEGEAAADANAAMGKILDAPDGGAKLVSLIEKSGGDDLKPGETFSFAEDIEPWLGEHAAIFISSFEEDTDPTVVIESTDTNAALEALREDASVTGETKEIGGDTFDLDSEDSTYFGAVGDFIVSGPEEGVQQAVDAFDGDSLGDSDEFKDSVEDLPENSLGTLYAQPKDFLDAIPPDDIDPSGRAILEKIAGDSLDEPVVGDLSATAEGIELDVSAAGGAETPPSSLLESVPAQSWLAISIGDLGNTAEQTIDQLRDSGVPNLEESLAQVEDATGASIEELTGALGEAALYVQGANETGLNGALIVQSNDTELTGRLLTQLQTLLIAGAGGQAKELSLPGGGTGFQFSDPAEAPQPFEVAQQGDKIAIAYGAGSAQQALAGAGGGAVGGQLSTTPAFAAAAGKLESLGVDLFLSFPTVFQLAENEGAAQDPEFQQAKPYIDALDYLAVGSGSEDDRAHVRLVIGLK